MNITDMMLGMHLVKLVMQRIQKLQQVMIILVLAEAVQVGLLKFREIQIPKVLQMEEIHQVHILQIQTNPVIMELTVRISHLRTHQTTAMMHCPMVI